MIQFIIGLFVGAVITAFAIALSSVAQEDREEGGEKDEQH